MENNKQNGTMGHCLSAGDCPLEVVDQNTVQFDVQNKERLPLGLREHGRFCVWRYEYLSGRKAKVPYNPITGAHACSNDPSTFGTFAQALAALEKGRDYGLGVGIFDGLAAIDIDHCIKDGTFSELARDIIDTMGCYTERSPSKKGIRILFWAKDFVYDTDRYYINNHELGLEVYVAGATNKYVTVTCDVCGTGNAPQLWQCDLLERGEALKTVLERYMLRPRPCNAAGLAEVAPRGAAPNASLSDEEVLEKARSSKNGGLFQALFAGDLTGYQSQSEADLALCNQLAFWCGGDMAQMDRLFRQSGLMREKWDRRQSGSTYGAITLCKAAASCQNVYSPPSGGRHYPMDGLEPPPEGGAHPSATGDAPPQRKWRIPESIPPFAPVDARTLQSMEETPLRFVVQGLLPEGLSMLASPPKYGKSWMVLDLALCVASGQPFLGRSTFGGRVLYLALEDSKRRLRIRTNRLLASETAPANLDLQTEARTLDNGLLEQMHQYMLDHPDTSLIIIDTFGRVRGKSTSEYSYSNDYYVMGRLKSFADHHHVALLLVHHLRKMRDEGDPFNQISGTNGIFGALDTAMVLTRDKRDDDVSVLNVTGRDVEGFEELLHFDKVSCHWESQGDVWAYQTQSEREVYQHDNLVTALQRLMAEYPDGWEGSSAELMQQCRRILGKPPLESTKSYVPALNGRKKQLRSMDGIWVDTNRKKNNMKLIRIWKVKEPEQSSMFDAVS